MSLSSSFVDSAQSSALSSAAMELSAGELGVEKEVISVQFQGVSDDLLQSLRQGELLVEIAAGVPAKVRPFLQKAGLEFSEEAPEPELADYIREQWGRLEKYVGKKAVFDAILEDWYIQRLMEKSRSPARAGALRFHQAINKMGEGTYQFYWEDVLWAYL